MGGAYSRSFTTASAASQKVLGDVIVVERRVAAGGNLEFEEGVVGFHAFSTGKTIPGSGGEVGNNKSGPK